mmetsp:Transcript_124416/g.398438  ORF Transcript_124416/g.398438 Transcript_124416/m.398438 type:complete len:160 (+) Transcript_124416:2751-3230(+)
MNVFFTEQPCKLLFSGDWLPLGEARVGLCTTDEADLWSDGIGIGVEGEGGDAMLGVVSVGSSGAGKGGEGYRGPSRPLLVGETRSNWPTPSPPAARRRANAVRTEIGENTESGDRSSRLPALCGEGLPALLAPGELATSAERRRMITCSEEESSCRKEA